MGGVRQWSRQSILLVPKLLATHNSIKLEAFIEHLPRAPRPYFIVRYDPGGVGHGRAGPLLLISGHLVYKLNLVSAITVCSLIIHDLAVLVATDDTGSLYWNLWNVIF